MIQRQESGVQGLDQLIGGGIPYPSLILLVGEPGTGKTTFAFQSLFHGAKQGQRGVYFTLMGQTSHSMLQFLSVFDFFDRTAIDNATLRIYDLSPRMISEPEILIREVVSVLERYSPLRIAFDPISVVREYVDYRLYREFLCELSRLVYLRGMLCYLISEYTEQEIPRNLDAYIADGIIVLRVITVGLNRTRNMIIYKLRGTGHSLDVLNYEIGTQGIRVLGPVLGR